MKAFGVIDPAYLQKRREEVNDLSRRSIPILLRLDAARPVHEERSGGTALMGKVLVEPKGRAGKIRPGCSVIIVGLEVSLINIMNFATTEGRTLRAGAIVSEKENHRIFELFTLF